MKYIGDWRYLDESLNLIYPWYTSPLLKVLSEWDISDWKVFEYGCGDSTKWWKQRCKEVISVDNSQYWASSTESYFSDIKEDYINFPKKFISDSLFDCIIIDGEPIEWRDFCIEPAISCLKKGGILIIDNYMQETVGLVEWKNADTYLKDKEFHMFKEPEHVDWKTAYWVN